MSKFLCLFRFPTSAWPAKPSSPEEMQKIYGAWQAWTTKFEKEILPGDGLKTGGALVKGGGGPVTDGPYIEAKEVVASYCMLETASLAQAIEIIKECPIGPNDSVEIRELAGYSM